MPSRHEPAETYVDEYRNIETNQTIRVSDDGTQMPGPGMLSQLLVRARTGDFRVRIATDG